MITADDLTDDLIREHLDWLYRGQYKLGEGPRAGLDKREAIRDCIAALSTSIVVVSARTKPEARERVAAAINTRNEAKP